MKAGWLIVPGMLLAAGCSKPSPQVHADLKTYDVAEDRMSAPVMAPENGETYDGKEVSPIKRVAEAPVSTFSIDVDTGSYANARRFLVSGKLPPQAAVRTEEMLNYFRYDYPAPADKARPFTVSTDVAITPWNPNTRLLRIGIRGYDVSRNVRPAANIVFLLDVSGSMDEPDKLPLLKAALNMMVGRLTPRDRVSIVVYAGAAGLVLEPTNEPNKIRAALAGLDAGGSTAGGEGIQLAYETARANFIKGGINRIILATDGDFNVGPSDIKTLEQLIAKNREGGISLSTLGFGEGNFNEPTLERLADVGNGNYAYIDSALEAQKVLGDELSSTLFTIAKDVKIQVEFNPAAILQYRLIGYENRALAEEDFDNDSVDAGDIGAGHQVTAIYEVAPVGTKGWLADRRYAENKPVAKKAAAGHEGEAAWLKLRYKLPDDKTSQLIEQPVSKALLASAKPATGDMAFAAAVAAFGQNLRGDKYLNGFSFANIRKLAGTHADYARMEFLKLAAMAENGFPAGTQEGEE